MLAARAGHAPLLRVLWLAASLAACAGPRAPQTEDGTLDRTAALAFANRLTTIVEEQALLPRDRADYLDARASLYAAIEADASVDRARLYGNARRLLATLDSDGHTILWSEAQTGAWYAATLPAQADSSSVARTIAVGDREVLVVRPPQTTFVEMRATSRYAALLKVRVAAIVAQRHPCGIVVDLTESKGGNAWPALAVVGGLVGEHNAARYADRNDVRKVVFDRRAYARWSAELEDQPDNPIERFRGAPFAVVVDEETASAGEMIAIVLRGEADARTFGRPTYGATTANVVTSLPDRATLLLTVARYAFGTAEPLRGRLQPDVPVDGTADDAAHRAAAWVAASAPTCRSAATP